MSDDLQISKEKHEARERLRHALLHVILLLGSAAFIFPLLWMLGTSLKPLEKTMVMPPQFWPDPIQWGNYLEAVRYIDFLTYTKNSLIVCTLSVLGVTLSSSFVAYGFSRIEWKGRDVFFLVTLSTMMVPFPVIMVPIYAVFRELHWIGSLRPLWVPAFFGGGAFNIFLLRQFFMGIPRDLTDAAHIDGCSHFRIWSTIVLPLSKPALAVVALFTFIFAWNDFLGPLLFLTKQENFTLALGLQFYQSQNMGSQLHLLMAATTLTALPIILLFFFTQKTFMQGIKMTGLKE